MIWLYCENCGWSGTPEELVSLTDDFDDRDFSFCPDCGKDEFEEEEEEDDDDY